MQIGIGNLWIIFAWKSESESKNRSSENPKHEGEEALFSFFVCLSGTLLDSEVLTRRKNKEKFKKN